MDMHLFANDDWTVTPEGLEHRGTGYFIGRDELGHRRADGLWTWPLHMADGSDDLRLALAHLCQVVIGLKA